MYSPSQFEATETLVSALRATNHRITDVMNTAPIGRKKIIKKIRRETSVLFENTKLCALD